MTSLDQPGRGVGPPLQKDPVAHYLDLGWALVPVPVGGKRPAGKGWQHAPVTTPEAARTVWRPGQGLGVGLLHSASGTAALDLDQETFARAALESVGVDLDALLTASGPKVRTSKGLKPLYRVPPGEALARHVLTWPDPDTGQPVVVLELRAGLCQDLLPPSVHPTTGRPYTWESAPRMRADLPLLPPALLRLWQDWSELKPLLEAACPWSNPPQARPGPDGSVIGLFNERFTVSELLERHGYVRRGGRYLAPASTSGVPGVALVRDEGGRERLYSHHASDPLADGHARDAFGVYCLLEHGGDVKAAVRGAGSLLGVSPTPPVPSVREAPWGERMRDLREAGRRRPPSPP